MVKRVMRTIIKMNGLYFVINTFCLLINIIPVIQIDRAIRGADRSSIMRDGVEKIKVSWCVN